MSEKWNAVRVFKTPSELRIASQWRSDKKCEEFPWCHLNTTPRLHATHAPQGTYIYAAYTITPQTRGQTWQRLGGPVFPAGPLAVLRVRGG